MLMQMAERRERLNRIEELLLRGITNGHQIAARLGVSQPVVWADIQHIRKAWLESGPDNTKERRAARIRQLERVIQLAHDSFHRSRADAETHTIRGGGICGDCKGLGIREGELDWCATCKGEGTVEGEVTIQVKGQAGDAAYLGIIKECVKEINHLEGNHAPKKHQVRGRAETKVMHAHLQVQVGEEYADAPPELILEAKSALLKLDQAKKSADKEEVPA